MAILRDIHERLRQDTITAQLKLICNGLENVRMCFCVTDVNQVVTCPTSPVIPFLERFHTGYVACGLYALLAELVEWSIAVLDHLESQVKRFAELHLDESNSSSHAT